MISTYDFQVEHPEIFSQLSVKDLLFLNYKCPQEEKKINLYTHYNKIIFKEIVIEIYTNAAARSFFYSIIPYFRQQPAPAKDLLLLKFKEFVFSILANPANAELLAYVNRISDEYRPLLQDIMDANFTFNLSLSEFARIAQRSLASFKRGFFETYHTSPGRWLTQKRLEYANHLLDTGFKNITEIAYNNGFESASHFSRIFKEKFGLSPMQYRSRYSEHLCKTVNFLLMPLQTRTPWILQSYRSETVN